MFINLQAIPRTVYGNNKFELFSRIDWFFTSIFMIKDLVAVVSTALLLSCSFIAMAKAQIPGLSMSIPADFKVSHEANTIRLLNSRTFCSLTLEERLRDEPESALNSSGERQSDPELADADRHSKLSREVQRKVTEEDGLTFVTWYKSIDFKVSRISVQAVCPAWSAQDAEAAILATLNTVEINRTPDQVLFALLPFSVTVPAAFTGRQRFKNSVLLEKSTSNTETPIQVVLSSLYRRQQKEGLRELSRLLLSNQSSLDQITILRESGIILDGNSGHQILAAATSQGSTVHIMQISLDKGDGTLLLASASAERSVNTSELDNALSELLKDLRWR